MSEKKTKSKKKKVDTEVRDYTIDDNKDYVIVLKPGGESKAYYPLDVVGQEPPAPVDARFVAVAHVLQDQESFEFVVNRFREANGLTDEAPEE